MAILYGFVGILFHNQGSNLLTPALEAWSLNYWRTREFLNAVNFNTCIDACKRHTQNTKWYLPRQNFLMLSLYGSSLVTLINPQTSDMFSNSYGIVF